MLSASQKFIIMMLFFLVFPASAAGDIYKWVDEEGGIHFTDSYESIPEKYRVEAEIKVKGTDREDISTPQESKETGKPNSSMDRAVLANQSKSIKVDKEGHDEGWWQESIKEQKNRFKQLQQEKAGLEADLQQLSKRYHNPAFGRQGRRSLGPEVEELQKKIKSLSSEIEKVKETLEKDLPEKAAKAGAPLEWLR